MNHKDYEAYKRWAENIGQDNDALLDAFLAGVKFERRSVAKYALNVQDPMAKEIGRHIRARSEGKTRGWWDD
jgi:hypothetical protein